MLPPGSSIFRARFEAVRLGPDLIALAAACRKWIWYHFLAVRGVAHVSSEVQVSLLHLGTVFMLIPGPRTSVLLVLGRFQVL